MGKEVVAPPGDGPRGGEDEALELLVPLTLIIATVREPPDEPPIAGFALGDCGAEH